jgi:uncharacterized protein YneF (UPF0154 family)
MKRLLAIGMIGVLMLHCFSRIGLFVSYQLNKDYIAKVLCINRDKPQMRCNGRCYLAKKIKAQEEREGKAAANTMKTAQELVLFCGELATFQYAALPAAEQQKLGWYRPSHPDSHLSDVFLPPRS